MKNKISNALDFKGLRGWSIIDRGDGEQYSDLNWIAEEAGRKKPSEDEIAGWYEEFLLAQSKTKHRRPRQQALRKHDGDGMDAIRKALDTIFAECGIKPPQEYTDYKAVVDGIKARFKKK